MDLNHDTGGAIDGWDHVVQSVQTILTTRLSTRVFRREFGSDVPALVDAPMNDAGLLDLYVAVAEALDRWEPRFEVTDVGVEPSADGVITLTLVGNYHPNGHIGDFQTVQDEQQAIQIRRDQVENWSVAA